MYSLYILGRRVTEKKRTPQTGAPIAGGVGWKRVGEDLHVVGRKSAFHRERARYSYYTGADNRHAHLFRRFSLTPLFYLRELPSVQPVRRAVLKVYFWISTLNSWYRQPRLISIDLDWPYFYFERFSLSLLCCQNHDWGKAKIKLNC